jgi:hypothetical protein
MKGRPEGGDEGLEPGQESTEAEKVKVHHRARRRKIDFEIERTK